MSELNDDIKDLIAAHGSPCISIIVPIHPHGIKVEQDKKNVLQAIVHAIHSTHKIGIFKQNEIVSALNELYRKINFSNSNSGVGLFVSPDVKKIIKLPLPVTKKILVNEVFDLRELLYVENYSQPYHLLDISKNEYHLFRGKMDRLEEICDENFPIKLVDDFEYARPSRSTSNAGYAHTKGFEKDKSILQKLRTKKGLQRAGKSLTRYLASKKAPLIVCGLSENISIFKMAIHSLDNVIFSMGDNYRHTSLHDLEVFAWTTMRSFFDEKKLESFHELKEKVNTRMAEYGIDKVWKATVDGRALKLLVEKDYELPAWVTGDNEIHLQRPNHMYGRSTDAVMETITTVLEKGGDVIVVENDLLKEFKRIATINRY